MAGHYLAHLALVAVVLVMAGQSHGAAEVLELTAANFNHMLEEHPLFVSFSAPYCQHCKKLAPVLAELAERFNGKADPDGIRIGIVDCTKHTALCSEHGVAGLKLFKNGAMEEYVQSRTFAAMEKYILEAGANTASVAGSASGAAGEPDEDNLIHGTNGNFASTIKFPGISFVKFYAPWCGHCKKLALPWADLGRHFKGNSRVRILKVDCTSERALCETQSIRAYPTLHVYRDGAKINSYTGQRTAHALIQFVDAHLASLPSSEGEQQNSNDGDGAVPPAKRMGRIFHLEPANFDVFLETHDHVFVLFGISGRIETMEALSMLEKLSGGVRDGEALLAFLDCRGSDFCGSFKLQMLPTFGFFVEGGEVARRAAAKISQSDLQEFLHDALVGAGRRSVTQAEQGHDEL